MATTISIFVNPLADRLDCAIRINGKEPPGSAGLKVTDKPLMTRIVVNSNPQWQSDLDSQQRV